MGINHIPQAWKNNATLVISGLFGALVSIPSMGSQTAGRSLFYVASGMVSAYYLAPVVTSYFNIGISPAGFLCGTFAGSIIAKGVEIVRSVRLQDLLSFLMKR